MSVAMVAVTPVGPPAQGDVDPDVQGAVACGGQEEHTSERQITPFITVDDQIIELRSQSSAITLASLSLISSARP